MHGFLFWRMMDCIRFWRVSAARITAAVSCCVFLFGLWKLLCMGINGDNYFMLALGERLPRYGFPQNDPLSMHTEMRVVMTQWLYAYLISLLYGACGTYGVFCFELGVLSLTAFAVYFLARQSVRAPYTRLSAVMLLLGGYFSVFGQIRPYTVTILLCFLEICTLELLWGSWRGLFLLFLLSVLQINFHNALWVSACLVLACYIAEHLFRKEPVNQRLWWGGYAFSVILLGGLVNPYGLRYMTYIIPSMSALRPFYPLIRELQPGFRGWMFWVYVLADTAFYAACFIRRVRIPIRFMLLSIGFCLMAALSFRNAVFYFSVGQTGVLFLIGELGLPYVSGRRLKRFAVLSVTVFFLVAAICKTVSLRSTEGCTYDACDRFMAVCPDMDARILSSFNIGSYLEFYGYHPYIDARAEVFGKEVNGYKDIGDEYCHMMYHADAAEFSAFLSAYDFEYLVLERSDRVTKMVEADGRYDCLYMDEYGVLYKK